MYVPPQNALMLPGPNIITISLVSGKKWRGGNNRSKNKAQSSQKNMDAVTKRILSGRRIKINELKNEVEALHLQLVELQKENKTLKRQNVLSERVLDKYEATENDMGNIMQKHMEETRALREQIRKQKR